jgi:hypothetical protein
VAATVTGFGSLSGLIGSETLVVSGGSASFANKNAGENKTVIPDRHQPEQWQRLRQRLPHQDPVADQHGQHHAEVDQRLWHSRL